MWNLIKDLAAPVAVAALCLAAVGLLVAWVIWALNTIV